MVKSMKYVLVSVGKKVLIGSGSQQAAMAPISIARVPSGRTISHPANPFSWLFLCA